MKDVIFPNSSSHFLISILSSVILGQEHGRTMHYHPSNFMDDRTMGMGRDGVN
jgi:hypothetical protein